MCVPVLPAVAVGLSLFQGLAMRSAAQDEARQIAKTERQNMVRAEESASKQVTAEGQKLSATQASEAQKAQRRRIAGIENIGKVKTLEGKGGNLMASLLMNEGRKTGDEINTINQSIESFARQSGRRVEGIYAQRDQRRSTSQSRVNQAYARIPSLTATLLGAGSAALPYIET